MARTCQHCGTSFESKSSRAKFCGPKCRRKAFDGRQSGAVVAEIAAMPDSGVPPMVDTVRAALLAGGQESSVAGVNALHLAVRIDAQSENGSAMAAMSRQLQALVAEALKDATVAADPLDELARRRADRRGA